MICIVDTDFDIRESICGYIKTSMEYETESVEGFLEFSQAEVPVKVELLIMSIPNIYPKRTLERVKKYNYHYPETRILGITSNAEGLCLQEIIGAGFMAVLCKDTLIQELGLAIRRIREGGYYFAQSLKCNPKHCS